MSEWTKKHIWGASIGQVQVHAHISVNKPNSYDVITCYSFGLIILVVHFLLQDQALYTAEAATVDETRVSSQWCDERVFGWGST